jgi:hypothetical protein
LTEVHRDTILRLLVLAGERCEKLLGEKIRNVPVQDVQLDEIQGFCFKKQKALRPGDDPNFGDAYTFVAIERHTKLVLNFALGKRDQQTTNAFVEGLRLATAPKPYQLTADGFPAYPFAIDATLSDRVDFAQLIKVYRATPEGERRYSPAEVVSTEIVPAVGNPDPKRVCTSHIERPEPHHADADSQADAPEQTGLVKSGRTCGPRSACISRGTTSSESIGV